MFNNMISPPCTQHQAGLLETSDGLSLLVPRCDITACNPRKDEGTVADGDVVDVVTDEEGDDSLICCSQPCGVGF